MAVQNSNIWIKFTKKLHLESKLSLSLAQKIVAKVERHFRWLWISLNFHKVETFLAGDVLLFRLFHNFKVKQKQSKFFCTFTEIPIFIKS